MSINDGGPAYPTPFHPDWPSDASVGMTLRDAFAIAALPALLGSTNESVETVALMAYGMADAMIRVRTQDASHE